ncbi:phosphoenolpyruvate synthase [Gilliamella sp. wkB178]|uniref:phosphoenolpyruvate synthase n=1 Tax=Gilliamella sp. wkB178 TaxID=3120259 RepID=UPI00080DF50F|nr:phosphoenolpyruvate synthase [Gilliamella apicola]OCG08954.1 phosphoenolpyruvate synthase [Gilliamella apicola]
MVMQNVIWFNELRKDDVESVGGKNSSLGEMISQLYAKGVQVPNGFATTAAAYRAFLAQGGLDQRITDLLNSIDVDDINQLTKAGEQIRSWILQTEFTPEFETDINQAWQTMVANYGDDFSVAVRSSATAEDLPDASFAGQQETFLNIHGIDNVKEAIKHVFASLYNDRAISYRKHQNYDHSQVALSVGVQKMVRSDIGSSGVMFTMDTESGFDKVVFITSAYGLGETVVQGAVNPDEFYVHKQLLTDGYPCILHRGLGSKLIKMEFTDQASANKSVRTVDVDEKLRGQFSINDQDILQLARYALIIEQHYGRPMDIEWGKDGEDGKLYILQARPETVKSRESKNSITNYHIKGKSDIICQGRAIGQKIGQGNAKVIHDIRDMDKIQPGDVLVTDMTDPDWEPIMKKASAIVTNRGGRTCHAAIIARELGIPAIVGCGNATKVIKEGEPITASCCEGDTGFIYKGLLNIEKTKVDLGTMPEIPLKIYMNIGNPELAFSFSQLPNNGVGLARMEFIINKQIGIHPKALLEFNTLPADLKQTISDRISGYASPRDFYIQKLAEGIAMIAGTFYPKRVILRTSDFKSNEYSNLIAGTLYEPHEENPMLGFRGAARYVSEFFRPCFELECEAIKIVRNQLGLKNLEIMIPFVRTVNEAKQVNEILTANGLERGKDGLRVIMMCEIPANAVLAEEFLAYFDGFSIGSNDMTQLTLGTDRDSGGPIATTFDERNPAVKAMLSMAIAACKKHNKYIGICGQGPSDHPDFAKWLVNQGIDSLSLNPDTVIDTWLFLANASDH